MAWEDERRIIWGVIMDLKRQIKELKGVEKTQPPEAAGAKRRAFT